MEIMCCAECRIHLVETQHSVRNITSVLWSKDLGQAAKEAAQIRQEAEAYSQKVHADADAYWKQVAARASKLLADQEALRQLIQSAGEVEINEEHSKSVP